MFLALLRRGYSAAIVVVLALASSGLAVTDAAGLFYEAYCRETLLDDPAGAVAAYERFLATPGAPADLVARAKDRLAGCREDLQAADLARLAPPDTVLYAELRSPGEHLARLVEMLGLVGDPLANIGQPNRPIPDAPGLVIPRQVAISAHLLDHFRAFRGAALAVTSLPAPGPRPTAPEGVLVIHPGDAQALRGTLETLAQFVQADDPIAGWPAVRIQTPELPVVAAFTHRLVVAGTSRALVAGVLERLQSDSATSLSRDAGFQEHAARRADALLYLYVNAPAAVRALEASMPADAPQARQRLAMMRVLFDLDHLQGGSLLIGSAADGLLAEATVTFAEGQNSLVYNLVRLPAMEGSALAGVPADAAAFVGVGVNPGTGPAPAPSPAGALSEVTGLDLGRELFANLREAAVFVVPRAEDVAGDNPAMPDLGAVLAVLDPARSEALWSYLLAVPGRMMGNPQAAPERHALEGHDVQAFSLPEGFRVYLARVDGAVLLGSSPHALAAALAAKDGKKPSMRQAATDAGWSSETSLGLWAHAGRIARVAAPFAPAHERPVASQLGELLASTTLSVAVEQSPTRLRLQARLDGLPQFEQIMSTCETLGVFEHHHGPMTEGIPAQ